MGSATSIAANSPITAKAGRTNKAKDVSFPFACPGDHEHPAPVKQRYVCVDEVFTYQAAMAALDEAEDLDQLRAMLEALEGHHSEQDDLPGYTVGELARYRAASDGTEVFATDEAFDQLFAFEGVGTPGTWQLVACEGAAGSSFCTFTAGGDPTLTVRVLNELASQSSPDAVVEVVLEAGGRHK